MDGRGDTQVVECTPATVIDHRLAFNMRMFPPLEPAMASIEPSAGDKCEGALYTLTREGYEALWKSEGGAMDRPGYEEMVVRASLPGGEAVPAITLRAAKWMKLKRDAPPSARYKKLIVDGATEVGLSAQYVAWLSGLRATTPSAALTAVARAHGVVAVLLFKLKLRDLLTPLRALCYVLVRGQQPGANLGSRLLDAASEITTVALLLPTAALGACIRFLLRLAGKENLVQFGPPPSRPQTTQGAQEPAASTGTPASATA